MSLDSRYLQRKVTASFSHRPDASLQSSAQSDPGFQQAEVKTDFLLKLVPAMNEQYVFREKRKFMQDRVKLYAI